MHTTGPLSLEPVPSSVAAARRWVTKTMDDLGCADLTDVVVLLVSEVVTNALLHGRGVIELDVRPHGTGVRVEVGDRSTVVPRRKGASLEGTTGRGLGIVEQLADDWGWRPGSAGKVVWFDVGRVPAAWTTGAQDAVSAS